MDDIEFGVFDAAQRMEKVGKELRGRSVQMAKKDRDLATRLESAVDQIVGIYGELLLIASDWSHVT